uniref:SCP domain-containing protein n=1 Tax=Meloidogyne javanica TaxID=6303 RepID=A0A915LZG3_MELJA
MFTTLISSTVHSIPTVEQNFIVACHNLFRSDVARGKGENSEGFLPEGANIKQIFYDNDLEKIARKWNCSGGNDEEFGENVYGYTGKPVGHVNVAIALTLGHRHLMSMSFGGIAPRRGIILKSMENEV